MSEQELENLMRAIGAHKANSEEAFKILDELVWNLKTKPEGMAILVELRRLIQMMENIHQAREDRKPIIRQL